MAGSYYSAVGSKAALGLKSDLDRINARLAEGRAKDTLRRGEKEYQQHKMRVAGQRSAQENALARNGVDLGFGSAAAILTGTDYLGEVDAETIKANAVREAWGHRLEASNLNASAEGAAMTGRAISPWMDAASTFLTSGQTVASDFYKLKNAGAYGDKGRSGRARRGR